MVVSFNIFNGPFENIQFGQLVILSHCIMSSLISHAQYSYFIYNLWILTFVRWCYFVLLYMVGQLIVLLQYLSQFACVGVCRKESRTPKHNWRWVQKDCKGQYHGTMVFAKGCCKKNAGLQVWRVDCIPDINNRRRKRVVSWGCCLWFMYGFYTTISSGKHFIWVLLVLFLLESALCPNWWGE